MQGPYRIAVAILAATFWMSCGGGGGSTTNTGGGGGPTGPPSGGGGPTNPNGEVVSPTPVTVAAGQTTSAVDIVVPSRTSNLNAEVLGVAATNSGGGTAFSSGASVTRGSTVRVILFGKGLSGSVQVSITGPNDITVSSKQSITADDDTPGVSFVISVSPSAAVGARTVVLRNSNDDITAFTGGLEVR